jgi:hypothetical protein
MDGWCIVGLGSYNPILNKIHTKMDEPTCRCVMNLMTLSSMAYSTRICVTIDLGEVSLQAYIFETT